MIDEDIDDDDDEDDGAAASRGAEVRVVDAASLYERMDSDNISPPGAVQYIISGCVWCFLT